MITLLESVSLSKRLAFSSSASRVISSSYVDYYWLQCPDMYPKSTSEIPSSAPPLPPEGTIAGLCREYCRILISVSVIMLLREFVRPLTRAIFAGAISCPSLCCRHSLEGSCLWLRCPRTAPPGGAFLTLREPCFPIVLWRR